ncbi:adenylyltransferase/cytidyltransferase family protein [Lentisphaerota bacterium WC36G]|nr:adenylyltransferase/cytidyltransferase family protein [Lentisphaerae bacterium WC36]
MTNLTTQQTLIDPELKILTLDEAINWRSELQDNREKLVMTNGCFDLLHRGHVKYLYEARKKGDKLLLLINSDESVRAIKGSNRPVNDERSRAYVVAALACIDAVVIFSGERCTTEIKAIRPDIYVKGGDYTVETLNSEERQALFAVGADIKFINFVDGFSTTNTIEKMSK